MRLLDTHTGRFVDSATLGQVPYAILSHTWDLRGEQTYQELRQIQTDHNYSVPEPFSPAGLPSFWRDFRLSNKIRRACAVARAEGFRYIWIDSCCIDKTSSAELSEAINSMYAWYRDAVVCYAFLADVADDNVWRLHRKDSAFRRSRWFRRGWTLQELLAPQDLVLLSQTWSVLGSKSSLAGLVEEITGIPSAVLTHKISLDEVSVGQRMSWAAKRQTTRIEDEAYSLLGIFDIHTPTLYGEGSRAFRRLQEEILMRIPDQSLFAWGKFSRNSLPLGVSPRSNALSGGLHMYQPRALHFLRVTPENIEPILAQSPRDFTTSCPLLRPISHQRLFDRLGLLPDVTLPEYTASPLGIRAVLPLLTISHLFPPDLYPHRAILPDCYLLFLACEHIDKQGHLVARVCFDRPVPEPDTDVERGTVLHSGLLDNGSQEHAHLFTLAPSQIEAHRNYLSLRTVYLPHPGRTRPPRGIGAPIGASVDLLLPGWARAVLQTQGVEVDLQRLADGSHPSTFRLRLLGGFGRIRFVFVFAYSEVIMRWEVESLAGSFRLVTPFFAPFGHDGLSSCLSQPWNASGRVEFDGFTLIDKQGRIISLSFGLDGAATSFKEACQCTLHIDVGQAAASRTDAEQGFEG